MKRFSRVLVCLVLICCILINCSPIRAKAVDPITAIITSKVAWDIAQIAIGAALGFVITNLGQDLGDVLLDMSEDLKKEGYIDEEGMVDVILQQRELEGETVWNSYFSADLIQAVRDWCFDKDVVNDDIIYKNSYDFTYEGTAYTFYANNDATIALAVFGKANSNGTAKYYYVTAWSTEQCTLYGSDGSVDEMILNGDFYYYNILALSTKYYYGNKPVTSLPIFDYWWGDEGFPSVGLTTSMDIMLNNVAPISVDLATGYPDWSGKSISIEDATSATGTTTAYPVSVTDSVPLGMTQADAQTGAITAELAESLSGALDDTFDGTVAATPWETFKAWGSKIINAITDIPAAITDFFTFDTDVSAWEVDLKSFFPFCIPWDIYNFFCLFLAEPEAPRLEFDIDFPYMNEPWHVVIDLSAWDGVAQLLRTLETIAFIVGLALFTREKFLRG